MRTKNKTTELLCLLTLAIGVCLSLIGCDNGTKVVEYAGNVEGLVIDSLTRAPLDSAWIRINPDTLNPPIAYTDSAGYYSFGLFTGLHRFHYCGKNGYATKKTNEYVVRKNKTTAVGVIELAPSQ